MTDDRAPRLSVRFWWNLFSRKWSFDAVDGIGEEKADAAGDFRFPVIVGQSRNLKVSWIACQRARRQNDSSPYQIDRTKDRDSILFAGATFGSLGFRRQILRSAGREARLIGGGRTKGVGINPPARRVVPRLTHGNPSI